jgi:hypothetical protein
VFALAIDDVENEKKLQRAFKKIDQDSSGLFSFIIGLFFPLIS